jgi:hypothetical protein
MTGMAFGIRIFASVHPPPGETEAGSAGSAMMLRDIVMVVSMP